MDLFSSYNELRAGEVTPWAYLNEQASIIEFNIPKVYTVSDHVQASLLKTSQPGISCMVDVQTLKHNKITKDS